MPHRFVTPVAPTVPTTVRQHHPAHSLFRHYRPWDAGTNVFLLKNGTVTTLEPLDPELIDTTFHGGHIHTVDDRTSALLIAAGYTTTPVAAEPPQPGLPGGNYVSPPVAAGTYTSTYGAAY